jgi:HEAT repeat protein
MARKSTIKKFSAVPPKAATAIPAPTKIEAVSVTEAVPKPVTSEVAAAKAPATVAIAAPTKAVATAVQPAAAAGFQKLLKDLESESPSTRIAAVVGIGRCGNSEGVKPLVGALRDVDADVAREAATSLGLLAKASAFEPLIDVLNNADGYFHSVVRSAAALSLAQIGDKRAVDALLNAVHDSIGETSAESIRALGSLGDSRAVNPLIQVVRNHDGYFLSAVRRAAVLALAQLGGHDAIAELRSVASDASEDAVVRETAGKAIHHESATASAN